MPYNLLFVKILFSICLVFVIDIKLKLGEFAFIENSYPVFLMTEIHEKLM